MSGIRSHLTLHSSGAGPQHRISVELDQVDLGPSRLGKGPS